MIEVPKVVRQARKMAGLTQAELAERAGTSQPAVARYETGASSPAVATLDRLLRACGATAELKISRAGPVDLRGENARLLKAHRNEILRILARRGFHSPRIFGSTATGSDHPDSDVDLLVTPMRELRLIDLLGAQGDLEILLETSVDVATEEILRPELRRRVVAESVPL